MVCVGRSEPSAQFFGIGLDVRQHIFGNGEKLCVRVVPGVTALVMRWGWKEAIGAALAPVWLALATGSVAGGAMLGVEAGSRIHDLRIIGAQTIGCRRAPRTQRVCACGHQQNHQEPPQTQPQPASAQGDVGHVSFCNSNQT